MPPNFANGKIYSIRSHQTDKIYIGSTTQSLAVRLGGHKRMDCSSKEILLFDDAYIELIELFPCASKMALNLREGEIIRERVCVNKQIAGRTKTEWHEDNKENIKQYRQDNKESISARMKQFNKQYYEERKKMRLCSCGGKYNEGKTDCRNKHYGSKHHISNSRFCLIRETRARPRLLKLFKKAPTIGDKYLAACFNKLS